MKNKKNLVILSILLVIILGALANIKVMDNSLLSFDELEQRNGKLYISRSVGIILNSEGDGKELNPLEPEKDYISYNKAINELGGEPGNVVVTYFVYNPFSNYYDDIIARYDFIKR